MLSWLDIPEFQDIKDNVIIKYLSPYEFCKISNKKEIIEKCWIFHIISRLKMVLKDKYSNFINNFNQKNAVISGSFLLQCFYDSSHQNSDIDVLYEGNCFLDQIFEKVDDYNEYNYENNLKAVKHKNYLYDNKIIQGIEYNFESINKKDYINRIWDHVVNNYDFDLCMNILYMLDNKSYIKIYNLEGLINKTINLCKMNTYTRNFRILKYKSRGFIINRKIDIEDEQNHRLLFVNKLEKGNYIYDAIGDDDDGQKYVKNGIYVVSKRYFQPSFHKNKTNKKVKIFTFYNNNLIDFPMLYKENLFYL